MKNSNKYFPMSEKYIEITEEEFNILKLENIEEEKWLSKSFNTIEDLTIYAYQMYPYFLKSLITHFPCKCEWLTINELQYVPRVVQHYKNVFVDGEIPSNKYLRMIPYDLGKDIISKGMYFPFFSSNTLEKNSTEKIAGFGSHRVIGLKAYQEKQDKKIDKTFLFITFPDQLCTLISQDPSWLFEKKERFGETIEDYLLIPIFDPNQLKLHFIYCNQVDTIRDCFICYSDWLGYHMFKVQNIVTPHKVLNDEKAFKEFINEK